MKRIKMLLISLLTIPFALSAQPKHNIKEVSPPAPEAAALGKYGEIPVNNNTGIPHINIPLYDIQAQRFSIPVGLSYHHAGFKPSEISSAVGLGWSLNAGGVITRKVNGFPDEFTNGFYNSIAYYESNVKNRNCFVAFDGDACRWRLKAVNGEIDLEPDEFFFNFNGKSGRIIINENKEVVCFPESDLKVTIDAQYNTWTVTDTDGVRYVFDSRETSTFRYGGNYTSTWYLSEVISPKGAEVVYFDYALNPTRWVEPSSTLRRQITVGAKPLYSKECDVPASGISQVEIQSTGTMRLTKIRFPKRSVEVNLSYANDRKDVVTGSQQRLTALSVVSQGVAIKNFMFNNNLYFGNISSSNYQVKRLKLRSVTETQSGAVHTFDYTETASLPEYVTPDIDHWGFYNGARNSEFIPSVGTKYNTTHNVGTGYNANRESNATYANTCMLQKITYPTKGYTQLTWESNIISYSSVSKETEKSVSAACASGNVSMNPSESSVADMLHFERPDDTGMPVNISISTFGVTSRTGIKVSLNRWEGSGWGYCAAYLYKTSDIPEDPVHYLLPTDLFTSSNSTYLSNNSYVWVNPGGYLLITIVSRRSLSASVGASLNFSQIETTYNVDREVGGLRIAKIQSHDGVNSTNDMVNTYSYKKDYLAPSQPSTYQRSSGKLFVDPYQGNYSNYAYIDECSNNLIRTSYLVDYYGDMARNTGYHIGYSEVTELIGNGGSSGFEITTYKNDDDPDSRSLVVSKKSYNSSKSPVHSIENTYTTSSFKQARLNVLKIKLIDMEKIGDFLVVYRPDFYETMPTYTTNSWYGLLQQKEKTYEGNNVVEVVTGYSYDGLQNSTGKHTFPTRKVFTNSNGEQLTEKTRYSFDFTTPNSWLAGMKNNHIIMPVEQQTLNGTKITSALYTQYNAVGETTAMYKADLGKVASGVGVDNSGNLASGTYYKIYAGFEWGNSENLLTQTLNESHSTTYLWGCNNTLPIVKVEGLKTSEIPAAVKTSISNYNFPANASESEVKSQVAAIKSIMQGLTSTQPHLVTIYTYKPNVGVTSITQPDGTTTYYSYDTAGRLKEVFLFEGTAKRILQSFTYNYKN